MGRVTRSHPSIYNESTHASSSSPCYGTSDKMTKRPLCNIFVHLMGKNIQCSSPKEHTDLRWDSEVPNEIPINITCSTTWIPHCHRISHKDNVQGKNQVITWLTVNSPCFEKFEMSRSCTLWIRLQWQWCERGLFAKTGHVWVHYSKFELPNPQAPPPSRGTRNGSSWGGSAVIPII